MKSLILFTLLFASCVTAPDYTFDDSFIELTGYVANGTVEPMVFKTDSTLHFIYDYNERDSFVDRVERTIIVRKDSDRLYFVAMK